MEIKDISFDPGKNEFKVTVPGKTFLITYEDYEELGLYKGMELGEELMDKLEEKRNEGRAKFIAVRYLSYRLRSEGEIRRRLGREGFDDSIIERTVERLKDEGYLDDRAFVKMFYRDKSELSRWSSRKIIYELKRKGVKNKIIREIITDPFGKDFENAKFLTEKKLPTWKRKSKNSYDLKNRMYRYLSGKGFDYEIISELAEMVL